MKKIRKFLNSVKKEMKKVHWPSKKEFFTYASATIVFIAVFAVFFSLTDFILAMLGSVGK